MIKDHNMKKAVLAGLVAGITIAVVNAATLHARAPASITQAGRAFCVYTQNDSDQAIKRLLTPELRTAWKAGVARNDKIAKARPDEKPPLGDGVPLAAFPDATPVCDIGKTIERGGVTMLEIHHRFPGQKNADWTDRLVLKQSGSVWFIDDVLFARNYREGLRTVLANAASAQ